VSETVHFKNEPALYEPRAQGEHVAIGRITLNGGKVLEVITVDREFLAGALQDARSWCSEHEVPGHSYPVAGSAAAYDAALAAIGQR
jgi:hypothetical protein